MKNIENLIVHFLITLSIFCITNETIAQTVSKQINDIKRNETFLFEEATAATVKEAREVAVVKLAKILSDYMEEKNPEGAKKLDDLKDLAEGAEEIVTDRGTQKRVFLYYNKQDIDEIASAALQANIRPIRPEQSPKDSKEVVSAGEVESQPSETILKSKIEPVVDQQEAPEHVVESVTSVPYLNKSVTDDSLPEWQKRLLAAFLSDGLTLISAKDLVNTYRIENKIKRYGSKSNIPTHTGQAFFVCADETGKIIAVLGRDNGGQRLNYITGNYEKLADYDSQNYIWFTLNN